MTYLFICWLLMQITSFYFLHKNLRKENICYGAVTSIISLIFIATGNKWEIVIGFMMMISYICSLHTEIDYMRYCITGFMSFMIIRFGLISEIWSWYSAIATIIFLILLHISLAHILTDIGAFFCVNALCILLRFVNAILYNYRFCYLTIGELKSIPTAATIVSEYDLPLAKWMILLLILFGISFITYAACVRNKTKLSIKRFMISIPLVLCSALILGTYSFCKKKVDSDCYLNHIEYFMESVITEIDLKIRELKTDDTDVINEFSDDEKDDIQPNIISILCESYSDISDNVNVTASRNPFAALDVLKNYNCKIGKVSVDTFGGGTSRSEWEYLTGLDLKKYSVSQQPFLSKVNTDYSFTSSEAIYEDYEKTVIHPLSKLGWNRESVYTTFGYDNLYFQDDTDFYSPPFDLLRGFITDRYLYHKTIEIMEENSRPQFIKVITLQTHGDYINLDLDDRITIEEECENKERIENFQTLIEHSSNDIVEFIEYLDEHKEEPTLVIFYGDHLPGGIFEASQENSYETPYIVYSNYCELKEMPMHLDLSLLYPNARKAAGLPLTRYEKYLLSLEGQTASFDFIVSRMSDK